MQEGLEWLRPRVSLMDLGEGPDQQIWVQRVEHTPFLGRDTPFSMPGDTDIWFTDVFGVDGEYLGRMDLPFPLRQMKLDGGYLYAISRNASGAPALIRYSYTQP